MQITTIGVDLAKHVFQLHGIGPDGRVVLRQKLRRGQMITFFAKLPPCLVGMEACATAYHGRVNSGRSGIKSASCRHTTSKPISSAARTMRPMQKRSAR